MSDIERVRDGEEEDCAVNCQEIKLCNDDIKELRKTLTAAQKENGELRNKQGLFSGAVAEFKGFTFSEQQLILENQQLQSENTRFREALQYIIDHKWVSDKSIEHWKWINEFVNVAEKALQDKGKK